MKNQIAPNELHRKKQSNFSVILHRLTKNRSAMLGLGIFAVLVLLAVFAPVIAPYQYDKIDVMHKFETPSSAHWFGTDELGRDILSRMLIGGRYSISIGILVTLLAMFAGSVLGALSGFFGGWVDTVIMRFLDIIQAVPNMLLTIAMVAVLGNGFGVTIVALSISRIPSFCRMLRAQFMSVSGQEYVEAANSMSVSKFRIITRHVLPNAFSPLIVQATMGIASAILVASSLSFIGLGIQPPTPEWGAMLSTARNYIMDYPHMVLVPGITIMITVLGLNMFGDGLRDAMDPKLKD